MSAVMYTVLGVVCVRVHMSVQNPLTFGWDVQKAGRMAGGYGLASFFK